MPRFGSWFRSRRPSSDVASRMRQCTALPDGTDATAPGAPLAGAVLVGGAVRDLWLGRTPTDLDWLVADPEAAARALAARTGGTLVALDPARGHWRVVVADATWDLAAPRGADLTADLRARDLTINALGWRPGAAAPEDPTGGLGDLRAGVIRAASPAALRDDPLRAWRVVRFAAQLGFHIAPDTRADAARIAAELASGARPRPAPERVGAELDAILATPRAAAAVADLDALGLLALDLPELAAGHGVPQGPLHHLDVFEHQRAALERLVATFPDADLALRWATLLHDVGKPPTHEPGAIGPDGLVLRHRFHGHDRVGAELAAAALTRLRRPHARVVRVRDLVAAHMRPLPDDARAARRFVHRLRPLLPDLLRLMIADRAAARGRAVPAGARRVTRERIGRVLAALAEPAPPAPLVDGHAVMTALGLAPGPEVGALLAAIAEARAVGDLATREEALAYAARLHAARAEGGATPPR